MKIYSKLVCVLLLLGLCKFQYAQSYNSPFEEKGVDYKIIKSDSNYITTDSFYNRIITKFDTIDLQNCIETGYYTPLYRKAYLIIRVDSDLNITLEEIGGNIVDYQRNQVTQAFSNLKFNFRKDLLEAARDRYVIQPLILFASDINTGPYSSLSNRLVKSPYFDSLKVGVFFEVLAKMYLPDFFTSTPVSTKPWLSAIFLPTVFVNSGENKHYYGAWSKALK